MTMKGLSKEKVIRQIKRIINVSYLFLGYIEFSNYISKKSQVKSDVSDKIKDLYTRMIYPYLFFQLEQQPYQEQ